MSGTPSRPAFKLISNGSVCMLCVVLAWNLRSTIVYSFAGGKKDSLDRTVVDTALREAREELGIHITEDQVWGVLKPLRDMVRLSKFFCFCKSFLGGARIVVYSDI